MKVTSTKKISKGKISKAGQALRKAAGILRGRKKELESYAKSVRQEWGVA